ncbi:hypothetical protein DL93DRAFT_1786254 [Clavulina sp. PMI_390]|nr:hypothetical protein DL93DRAFT_1786254 [Clavulina sp. PMI_390]
MANIPALARLPVFALVLIFSLVVLGLDAHFDSEFSGSTTLFGITYTYSAPGFSKLGIATAVLTLVSLIPMLVIDFIRKGAPTSLIVVELGWLGFLWIMWLATAADTASFGSCSDSGNSFCSQFQAAEALSFLTWLLLMGYWILLLVFSVMAHSAGNQNVWMTGVSDAEFTTGGVNHGPAMGHAGVVGGEKPVSEVPATYPPHSNV